jgi:hypothetical protein
MIEKKNQFKINQILKYEIKKNHKKPNVKEYFFLKGRPNAWA